MVSPGLAVAIAARSEAGPLSRLLRTVSVLGRQRSSRASSCSRQLGRLRDDPWLRPLRAAPCRFPNQEESHMMLLLSRDGLRENDNAIAAGAQTGRRGVACCRHDE